MSQQVFAAAQTITAASSNSANVVRTKAMHYRQQGGVAKIEFQGTGVMLAASGEAKVEGKKTNLEIDAKFTGLDDATKFGLEYLTYVL